MALLPDEDHEVVTEISTDEFEFYSNRKTQLLIALLVYAAISGAWAAYTPTEDPITTLLMAIPTIVIVVAWCFTDAAQRNFVIGRMLRVVLVLILILGVPLYLFRTRGFQKGLWATGLALLTLMAMTICELIGSEVVSAVMKR